MPFKDPEKYKAYQREYQARYYAKHREGRKARIRRWKQRNSTEVRDYNREYRNTNLEAIRGRDREYARRKRADPVVRAQRAAQYRRWRQANPDKYVASYKNDWINNNARRRAYNKKYWARRISLSAWKQIIQQSQVKGRTEMSTGEMVKLTSKKDELFKLAQRFRALQDEQRDLDFRLSTWARDARAVFPSDEAFSKWCDVDLGLTETQANELLFRGRAAELVPDVKAWRKLGGLPQIRAVEGLPKREQVASLEAAKASGRSVRAIVRERNPPTEIELPTRVLLTREEAVAIVEYLGSNERAPKAVRQVVNKIRLSLHPREVKAAA